MIGCCLYTGSVATAAIHQPLTFNAAMLVAGKFVFREQFVLDQSGHDPSALARDRQAMSAVSGLGYGITNKLALFGVVPYVNKRLELTTNDVRQTQRADGLGDLSLFARYTVFKDNAPGRTFLVAPFAGLKFPTGDDNETDASGRLPASVQPGSGSWDPFGGILASYITPDFNIDAQVSYKANTRANNFEFGDVARLDGSLQYRLWPQELGAGGPGFFYGVLDGNLIYQDQNEVSGVENLNSGGLTLLIVPGLQYVTRWWIIESGVQIPLVQDLNGSALEKDYIFRAGFRFNF
jgi:hypothetical protein